MRKQNQRQQNTEEGESLRVGVGEEKSKSEKKKIIAKNPISREDGTDSSSSVAIWQTHMRGKKDKKNHTEWWGRGGGQRCALGSSAFGDPSWRGWRGAAALHPSPLLTSLTLGAVTPKAKAEEWHPDRGLPPGVRASGARPPPRGFPRLRPTLRAKRCCSLRGFSSLSPPSSSPGQGCGPSAGHTSASLPSDASLSLCTTQTPEGNLLRDLASPAPGGALAPKFPFRTSAHLDVGTGTGLCRSPKPRGAGGGRGGRGVRGGTPERPPPHPQPPLSPFLESVFKAAYGAMARGRLGSALPFLLVLLDLQYQGAECGINAEVEKQLEMGKKLLAAGQLADALSHFHAAIEGDSDNYIAYYRRATVYLAMGKSKAAIRDLSKVVELKQDFTSARLQRGHLLLKQGKFDEAEDDFKNVLKSNPSNNEEKEAQTQLTKSDELQRLYSQALSAYRQEDYEAAIPLLDEILAVCVWDAELRELRAECYIKEGEPSKAISDLKAAAKLKSDNTEAFYKISRIYYQLGDHELSLSEVRECLKLDQDHKQCFSLYKQVKKLNKQIESAEEFIREGRYEDAISKYDSVMKTEPDVPVYATRAKERICHCLSKNQQATEAITVCTQVLQLEPTNVNALKDRAEAYLLEDLYEEAIKDYETAQANSENDQQIREGLERAQRMLKQSQKRDYYKILGVKRNARKQEIIKAYRKLASQWHPDNFQSEEEKKKAEKKFIDIAAAKEVLTDPEMRRKFDAGEDPLDAESQQGGGNPFHRNWNTWQGFNPFGSGGGPFTFKFHFS